MKTTNWKSLLRLSEIIVCPLKVEYTLSDLFLTRPKRVIEDVETVIITLYDGHGELFIGVAQTSPKDAYSKALGREIAAGRLLKAWDEAGENKGAVWISEDGEESVCVFGHCPEGVDIDDKMIYS